MNNIQVLKETEIVNPRRRQKINYKKIYLVFNFILVLIIFSVVLFVPIMQIIQTKRDEIDIKKTSKYIITNDIKCQVNPGNDILYYNNIGYAKVITHNSSGQTYCYMDKMDNTIRRFGYNNNDSNALNSCNKAFPILGCEMCNSLAYPKCPNGYIVKDCYDCISDNNWINPNYPFQCDSAIPFLYAVNNVSCPNKDIMLINKMHGIDIIKCDTILDKKCVVSASLVITAFTTGIVTNSMDSKALQNSIIMSLNQCRDVFQCNTQHDSLIVKATIKTPEEMSRSIIIQ